MRSEERNAALNQFAHLLDHKLFTKVFEELREEFFQPCPRLLATYRVVVTREALNDRAASAASGGRIVIARAADDKPTVRPPHAVHILVPVHGGDGAWP